MRTTKFRVWDKLQNQYVKHQYIGSEMYVDIDGFFNLEQDGIGNIHENPDLIDK